MVKLKEREHGVYNYYYGSTTTITGGSIQGDDKGIYNSGYVTLDIQAGNIKGGNYGIYANSSPTINITGGTVEGKQGLYIGDDATITIGIKDNDVNTNEPIIIGEEYGITQHQWGEYNNRNLSYYDGKIAGKTKAIEADILELEEGKQINITKETIKEQEYEVATLGEEDIYEDEIASIGDITYTTVSSFKKAISEIPTSTKEPVEVTILNNFSSSQSITINYNQNIKINLNGKIITTTSAIINNGTLEITDMTETHEGKIINTNTSAIKNHGSLTVTKGTIEGAYHGINNQSRSIKLGTKDGEVDATTVSIIGKKYFGIFNNYDGNNKIQMYDGTIKGKYSVSSDSINETEEGYVAYEYQESGYYITTIKLEAPIARTGGQDYNSLQEAIDNCENGETVEILRNVESSHMSNTITIAENQDITLDLKGYQLNSKIEKTVVNNGTLNIESTRSNNGRIYNDKSDGITVENNGTLNLLTGTIYGSWGKAIENNGTMNMAGGDVNGYTYGINNNVNATLTISLGTISSYQYGIYNSSTNAINITGGKISGSNYNGHVYGIYNNANADIMIAASDVISISSSGYGYGIYNAGEGTVKLQQGSISVKADYLGYGIKNAHKGKVEITGGNITVTSNDGYAYGVENGSLGSLSIENCAITASTTTGTSNGIRNLSLSPLTIKSGTIKAIGNQSTGIYSNTSNIILGNNDESITTDVPIIESDDIGIYINEVDAKFNFYDGKVIGKVPFNTGANTVEGYKIIQYYDKDKQKEVATLSESDNYVLTYYLNGEKYESVILKSGSVIPKKIIDEEGYEFSGWQNLPETMPEEDIDVYATLTPKTYTITYYVDGEQYGEVDTFEYKSDVTPREEPTKEGHEFSGWSEIPETMPAEDIEVRGVFTYTATFYNEDKTSVISTVDFTINDESITEPEVPEKEGYLGWWSDYEIKAEDLAIQLIYVEKKAVVNKTKAISYDSVETAMANADIDGTPNEIFLTEDVTAETTITVLENANVTLDLNGYTITNNSTYCGINNYGTITIENNSASKIGTITVEKADTDVYGIYNRENANLTILLGNIKVTANEGYTGTGIYNNENATMTLGINDKEVSTTSPNIQASTFGINNATNATLNFYDGKAEGTSAIQGTISEVEFGYRTVNSTNSETNIQICSLEKIPNGTNLQATDENGITWNYTYQDEEATNVYYESGTLGETVIIPSTLNKYPVVSLCNNNVTGNIFVKNASETNTIVKSIIIPEGVTNIGSYAFYNCTSLTSIEIPDSITSIGYSAFSGCSSLTSIEIPDSITNIGNNAFSGCSSLTSIYIPEGVTNIGSYAFYGCGSLTSIEIPEGVTSIGNSAFSGCSSLTSIEIPEGVTSIGGSAFSGCSSLTSIEIPEGVTSIPDSAFISCTGLISVVIGNSVTSMDSSAFSGCSSLASISVNINNQKYSSEDGVLFNKDKTELILYPQGKKDITEYSIINSVTRIGNFAFSNCSSLTSIEIPDSVTSIGSFAFYYCSNLKNVIIGNSVTSMDSSAFSGCSSLASISVNINNQKYSSEDGVLFNKDKTELILYPQGKKDITKYSIINSVTSIGNSSFYGCSSLTSIEIPNSVISIEDSAFSRCSSLTSIDIQEGVTNIGSYAFSNCSSLISIEIPDSVTSIEDYAFKNCSNMTDIYIGNMESAITFGSDWKSGTNAYVHYGDCKHDITISTNLTGDLLIQEVGNKLENGKITCGETFQFRIVNESGEIIDDNIQLQVISQGGFTNSAEVIEIISKNEEGIYTIKDIRRNKKIDIGEFKNGLKYQTTDENGITWHYTYKDEEATNVYYESGTLGETVIIPSTLDKYPVVSLCNNVTGNIFVKNPSETNTTVKSIIIPEGVRNIGSNAFYNCTSLTSIEIPNSVTSIGSNAFYNTAWYNNQSDGLIYIGKIAHTYKGEMPENTTIQIKEGTTIIGDAAFYDCSSLISIEIPDSVTSIGSRAFDNCTSLTSIEIPNSVTSIGSDAFYNCISLTSIEIPEGVTSIGWNAFYNTAWYNNQSDGLIYIGKIAYTYKGEMPENTTIQIKEGTTIIQSSLFSYEVNLVAIEIPDSVTSIGNDAFNKCTNLKNVAMSKNIKYIGSAAFGHCTSLENIVIWKTVDELGYRTFDGWKNDQTINMEADEVPEGWDENWNYGCNAKIVYGYTGD